MGFLKLQVSSLGITYRVPLEPVLQHLPLMRGTCEQSCQTDAHIRTQAHTHALTHKCDPLGHCSHLHPASPPPEEFLLVGSELGRSRGRGAASREAFPVPFLS